MADIRLQKASTNFNKNMQLLIACKNTVEHLRRITKIGEEYSVNLINPDKTLEAIDSKLSKILDRIQ